MPATNGHQKAIAEENARAARGAGLIYVEDFDRGIRRLKAGHGFKYLDSSNRAIANHRVLGRIKSLVIPPAWEDVWICPQARGHIQAIGRDARGRKQYLYHPRWREARDQAKYCKVIDFACALPRMRRAIKKHLALPGLPRDKVLAAVVAIMERTFMRVGNEEYAKSNESFGLTTLKDEHARINGKRVHFEFRGKSGVKHDIDLEDPKLAEIVRRCRDLPQEELFAYLDEDDQVCDVTSADVNEYIRTISGGDFTAKDFRTWAGTVLAARALCALEPFASRTAAKRNIVRAIDQVAQCLGNTRAVCRKSYIHPQIIGAYLAGTLVKSMPHRQNRAQTNGHQTIKLTIEETAVLTLLRRDSPQRRRDRREVLFHEFTRIGTNRNSNSSSFV